MVQILNVFNAKNILNSFHRRSKHCMCSVSCLYIFLLYIKFVKLTPVHSTLGVLTMQPLKHNRYNYNETCMEGHALMIIQQNWNASEIHARGRWKGKIVPVLKQLSTMPRRERRKGDIAPPFLTSALDWGEWSVSSPSHFTPISKESLVTIG
jgi:hypothetical protein